LGAEIAEKEVFLKIYLKRKGRSQRRVKRAQGVYI
jgi:hypothetical protein